MPVLVTCTLCGQSQRVSSRLLGSKVACAGCHKPFVAHGAARESR